MDGKPSPASDMRQNAGNCHKIKRLNRGRPGVCRGVERSKAAPERTRELVLAEALRQEIKPPAEPVKAGPAKYEPTAAELKLLAEVDKMLAENRLNDLTLEHKAVLKKAGIFEDLGTAPEAKSILDLPPDLIEAPPSAGRPKVSVSRIQIESPLGKMEDLGHITAADTEVIKAYAKSHGLEDKLHIAEPKTAEWPEYLPPPEQLKFIKGMIRDVKSKPAKEWKSWEPAEPPAKATTAGEYVADLLSSGSGCGEDCREHQAESGRILYDPQPGPKDAPWGRTSQARGGSRNSTAFQREGQGHGTRENTPRITAYAACSRPD